MCLVLAPKSTKKIVDTVYKIYNLHPCPVAEGYKLQSIWLSDVYDNVKVGTRINSSRKSTRVTAEEKRDKSVYAGLHAFLTYEEAIKAAMKRNLGSNTKVRTIIVRLKGFRTDRIAVGTWDAGSTPAVPCAAYTKLVVDDFLEIFGANNHRTII